jgi:hypothetical protein
MQLLIHVLAIAAYTLARVYYTMQLWRMRRTDKDVE